MTKILTDAGVGTLWARVKEKVADVTDEPISDDIINAICDGAQPPDDGDTSGTLYVGHVWKGTREQFYALAKTDDFTKYYVALDDAGVAAGEWIGIYDGACLPLLNKPCVTGTVNNPFGGTKITVLGAEIPITHSGNFRLPRKLFNGVTSLENWLDNTYGLLSIDVSAIDTSRITNMKQMFSRGNFTHLDLSNFDTSHVTDMSGMFNECEYLTIVDIAKFDVSNVTDMNNMFFECKNLEFNPFIRNWDTSNVENMASMFASSGIKKFTGFKWNMGKVKDLGGFLMNTPLEDFELPFVAVSIKPTNVSSMFSGCEKLKNLMVQHPLGYELDLSDVTDMSGMFSGCTSLESIYIPLWDLHNVGKNGFNDTFYGCTSLTEISGTIRGISQNFDVCYSPLTAESAMKIIQGLSTVTEARTLFLSDTTYAALTEQQIAQATSKGWTVKHPSA